MWNQVDQRIRSALRGIRLAFRGRLTRVKSDLSIQQVQVNGLAGEKLQDAELFQHFGFTSCPPAGTQCIVLPIGGQTSHSIIIATENGAYRLQVASGEVAIYSDEGAFVHIKKGRIVEVECDEYHVKTKNIPWKQRTMASPPPPAQHLRHHYSKPATSWQTVNPRLMRCVKPTMTMTTNMAATPAQRINRTSRCNPLRTH